MCRQTRVVLVAADTACDLLLALFVELVSRQRHVGIGIGLDFLAAPGLSLLAGACARARARSRGGGVVLRAGRVRAIVQRLGPLSSRPARRSRLVTVVIRPRGSLRPAERVERAGGGRMLHCGGCWVRCAGSRGATRVHGGGRMQDSGINGCVQV